MVTAKQLARFWAKVDKSGPNGCWVWTAGRYTDGYGQFRIGNNKRQAHRISYELANGPIPEGLRVLHSCDNPGCVNPAHLKLGTNADNSAEMVTRGRQAKGENNGNAKLTDEQYAECAALHATGELTYDQLALRYNMSRSGVRKIVRRSKSNGG